MRISYVGPGASPGARGPGRKKVVREVPAGYNQGPPQVLYDEKGQPVAAGLAGGVAAGAAAGAMGGILRSPGRSRRTRSDLSDESEDESMLSKKSVKSGKSNNSGKSGKSGKSVKSKIMDKMKGKSTKGSSSGSSSSSSAKIFGLKKDMIGPAAAAALGGTALVTKFANKRMKNARKDGSDDSGKSGRSGRSGKSGKVAGIFGKGGKGRGGSSQGSVSDGGRSDGGGITAKLLGGRKVPKLPRHGRRVAGDGLMVDMDADEEAYHEANIVYASALKSFGTVNVPEGYMFIAERDGRFSRMLPPGRARLGLGEKVTNVHNMSVQTLRFDDGFITHDREEIGVSGYVQLKVEDPYLASYACAEPLRTILHVAMDHLRNAILRMRSEMVFDRSEELGFQTMVAVNLQARGWGFRSPRVMLDVLPSMDMRQQMHVRSQKERANIIALEDEQRRQHIAAIKQEALLNAKERASYAQELHRIHSSQAEAEAAVAEASAEARIVREFADVANDPNFDRAIAHRVRQMDWTARGIAGHRGAPSHAEMINLEHMHMEDMSRREAEYAQQAASVRGSLPGMPGPGMPVVAPPPEMGMPGFPGMPSHMPPPGSVHSAFHQGSTGELPPHQNPAAMAEMDRRNALDDVMSTHTRH